MSKTIKPYEELTFIDDFMFCKVLSYNLDLCKELLELILQIKIRELKLVEGQKTILTNIDSHGVRFDVFAEDDESSAYDIEMQMYDKSSIAKRMRYYQSSIDTYQLDHGVSYDNLKKSFIIFICLEDFFNQNLPIYTFKSVCSEKPDYILNDGITKVVINASGIRDGLSQNMLDFLDFLKYNQVKEGFTQRLNDAVNEASKSSIWRHDYMTLEMKIYEERKEAFKEGKEEEKRTLLIELVKNGLLDISEASKRLNITNDEFSKLINN